MKESENATCSKSESVHLCSIYAHLSLKSLWAWLALYFGGEGFTVAILKIETWSKNEKVSLGQMLNFLFSDLVSIFYIATVNPKKQERGAGYPP